MANWTYQCYDDGKAKNLWLRWYEINEDFNGTHDSVFEILEQQESWGMPQSKLINKSERIFEIRLTGSPKHRIFGFFANDPRQRFVILGTGTHKQNIYTPKDILKTIVDRKKAILAGTMEANICARPQ